MCKKFYNGDEQLRDARPARVLGRQENGYCMDTTEVLLRVDMGSIRTKSHVLAAAFEAFEAFAKKRYLGNTLSCMLRTSTNSRRDADRGYRKQSPAQQERKNKPSLQGLFGGWGDRGRATQWGWEYEGENEAGVEY